MPFNQDGLFSYGGYCVIAIVLNSIKIWRYFVLNWSLCPSGGVILLMRFTYCGGYAFPSPHNTLSHKIYAYYNDLKMYLYIIDAKNLMQRPAEDIADGLEVEAQKA